MLYLLSGTKGTNGNLLVCGNREGSRDIAASHSRSDGEITLAGSSDVQGGADDEGLLSLGPSKLSDDEKAKYDVEFRFALNNKDIKNIALAGSYGSGKSTVAKTFAEEGWLFISLAHFGSGEQTAGKDSKESGSSYDGQDGTSTQAFRKSHDIQGVEAALLTQIIHKVDLSCAPKSRFKKPFDHTRRFDVAMASAVALFLVLSAVLVWGVGKISFQSSIAAIVLFALTAVVWAILAGCGIYRVIRSNALGRFVKRLRFLDAELEFADMENQSVIDRYMSDLIYLVNKSGYDVIVFEDLDRFDSVYLFEKLREVNLLANDERSGASKRKKQEKLRLPWSNSESDTKPLKFLYLVRDSLFESASDRTKFFDYIIPVIPYVDPNNAFDVLKEALSNAGVRPPDEFLYQLSVFVDDSRMLHDIVNECHHFRVALFGENTLEERSAAQLVAIISYKVFFPDDFEKLQIRRGYLYALFASKKQLISYCINKEVVDEVSGILLEEFELSRQSVADLMRISGDLDACFSLSYIDRDRLQVERGYIENLQKDVHFSLVRFLVINGWIDESYSRFVSNFYPGSLSSSDRDYVTSVLQGVATDVAYRFDNPDAVLLRLGSDDLSRANARNYAILRHLLCQGKSDKLTAMIRGVVQDKDKVFLVGYVCSDSFDGSVFKCLASFGRSMESSHLGDRAQYKWLPIKDVLEDESFGDREKLRFCQRAIAHGLDEVLREDAKEALADYANEKYDFLDVDPADVKALGCKLSDIGFKTQGLDLANCNVDLLGVVYDEGLFSASAALINGLRMKVRACGDSLAAGNLLTSIFEKGEESPLSVITDDPNLFVSSLLSNEDQLILDSEDAIVWLLGSPQLSQDKGVSYIQHLAGAPIANLGLITNDRYKRALLKQNAVVCTFGNILPYFEAHGMDDALVAFLEQNNIPNDSDQPSGLKDGTRQRFLIEVAKSESITDIKLEQLAFALKASIDPFSEAGISEQRMGILVKTHVVGMSSGSLLFLRTHYSKQVVRDFAIANFKQYLSIVMQPDLQNANPAFFDETEASALVGTASLPLEGRLVLLKGIGVMSPSSEFESEINIELLTHHFNKDYVDSLPKLYKTSNGSVREQCVLVAAKHAGSIIQRGISLPVEMMEQMVPLLAEDHDGVANFIAAQMACGKKDEWKEADLSAIFTAAGLTEFAELLAQTQKTFEDTPINAMVLKQLCRLGVITDPKPRPNGKLRVRISSTYRKKHGAR